MHLFGNLLKNSKASGLPVLTKGIELPVSTGYNPQKALSNKYLFGNCLNFSQNNSTQITLPGGVSGSNWANEWTLSNWWGFNKGFPSTGATDTYQTSGSGSLVLFRHLRVDVNNWKLQFLARKNSGTVITIQSSNLPFDYKRHNEIFTCQDIGGGNYTIRIYLDGIQVASGNITTAERMITMANALIGKNQGVDSFNGVIGDSKLIENYVADSSVVEKHWNKAKGSNNLDSIPKKFWYKFNETSGTSNVSDSSGNNYTAVMAGFTGNPFELFM
jgi:hypothetical protein